MEAICTGKIVKSLYISRNTGVYVLMCVSISVFIGHFSSNQRFLVSSKIAHLQQFQLKDEHNSSSGGVLTECDKLPCGKIKLAQNTSNQYILLDAIQARRKSESSLRSKP